MTKRYFLFAVIIMCLAFTLIAVTFYIKKPKEPALSSVAETSQFDVTGLVPFDQWAANK